MEAKMEQILTGLQSYFVAGMFGMGMFVIVSALIFKYHK